MSTPYFVTPISIDATPHEVYTVGRIDTERQPAFRAMFRSELDEEALADSIDAAALKKSDL